MRKIAILASGTGTNARRILEYFEHHPLVEVVLVLSNKKSARVLDVAEKFGVDRVFIDREHFYDGKTTLQLLQRYKVDLVVLAGFLWRIPEDLVSAYSGKMVNIHPALLPKFGGKGMYGMHVHRAVKEAGEPESGITIHLVNEHYDEGAILFQEHCQIVAEDEPEDIARKVQALEHKHFAPVIEQLLT